MNRQVKALSCRVLKTIFAAIVAFSACASLPSFAATADVKLLLRPEEAATAREHLTGTSAHSLDIATYELENDAFSYESIAAWIKLATSGRKVRVIVDDVGIKVPRAILAHAAAQGVEIRIFKPNFWRRPLSYLGTRNHEKILVSDSTSVILGSRNYGGSYFHRESAATPRIDQEVLIRSSELAKSVTNHFDLMWESAYVEPIAPRSSTASARHLARFEQPRRASADLQSEFQMLRDRSLSMPLESLHFIADDVADKRRNEHLDNIVKLIDSAKRTILMSNAYIVLPKELQEAILRAKSRGVTLAVVTNSWETNNVALAQAGFEIAARPFLLKHDIPVFEFADKELSLHSKAFVVDNVRSYVGSFNWDYRSVMNFESGIAIEGAEVAKELTREIASHARSSIRIKQAPFLAGTFCGGLRHFFAYFMTGLL